MVVEQLLQHVPGKGFGIAAIHTGDQGPLLDGHGQIHHMGGIGPYALGLLILIGMEETLKIIPLLLKPPGQAKHPVLRTALIEPIQGNQRLEPAQRCPVMQRIGAGKYPKIIKKAIQHLFHAPVSAQVRIHGQHFGNEDAGPKVIGMPLLRRAGAEPAILALAGQNAVNVILCPGDQIFVPEQIGQGDKAVQPVRYALPAVAVAANPAAVAYVGPDFIQVAAQAVCPECAAGVSTSLGVQSPPWKKSAVVVA